MIIVLNLVVMSSFLRGPIVVLSVIEGLADSIASFTNTLEPRPSLVIPEPCLVTKIMKEQEVQAKLPDSLQNAEFFVADPDLFAKILPQVQVPNIKVSLHRLSDLKNFSG